MSAAVLPPCEKRALLDVILRCRDEAVSLDRPMLACLLDRAHRRMDQELAGAPAAPRPAPSGATTVAMP